MTNVFQVAAWVDRELQALGLSYAVIGGIALQVWGESRVTRDVDISLLTGFGNERETVSRLLEVFPSRRTDALEFAVANRVLLCQSPEGIGVDIGLAAFPFEEAAIGRSRRTELIPGVAVPVVSAEDLITMKVFAGRPQDWIDVRGILVRQGNRLDCNLVESTLPELLDLIGEPERMERLNELRRQTELLR
jgi:hypothetical protein